MAFYQTFRATILDASVAPIRMPQITNINPADLATATKNNIVSISSSRKLSCITEDSPFKHLQIIKKASHRKCRSGGSLYELTMIDSIQRLGIDYYFREEIKEVLDRQYVANYDDHGCDLHEVALRFRLLRQEGYNVPADVFNRFKDKDGNFKQELSRDIQGLMSMFEASQLSTEGEDILDEANEFSEKLLNASMKTLHLPLAMAVENALKHPYHKSLAMFTSEDFLNTCSDKRI
ncbi:hypothetical protein Ancab_005061 [Ancistrocladus abbreviatus]